MSRSLFILTECNNYMNNRDYSYTKNRIYSMRFSDILIKITVQKQQMRQQLSKVRLYLPGPIGSHWWY
jgi:hypothetical protein